MQFVLILNTIQILFVLTCAIVGANNKDHTSIMVRVCVQFILSEEIN